MKARHAILCALSLLAASPAHAEKLLFDPRIGATLDSSDKDMILFDARNPRYVFDRIALQGSSAQNWTEALEIIVRTPDKAIKTTGDWLQQIRDQSTASCTSQFTAIAQDATSLTFMRQSDACAAAPAETALYRIVAGRKSLFLLNARYKGAMDAAARERWLTLLATARVTN
ncbi:MAG: hypothetical protein ABIQ81_00010 [Novosphingobium sp.]